MPDTYTPEKFTFSPARRERVGLAIALAGSSGSGKTKSALELATGMAGPKGRICVIDTEGRRALHYATQYTFDHLDFQPPYTPERCTQAIIDAQTAGYDVVIFDSASDEYEGEGGLGDIHDAEARRMATDRDGKIQEWKIEAMNAPAWKTPKLRHKSSLIRRIRSFPGFVIFCLRAEEKVRFEKIKDERTGREKNAIVQAGWIPICEKRFMYDMTLSLTLAPESKGKPRFDLTHKITDDHVPFFPENEFIGRRAGELLRLWATGADIPENMRPAAPKAAAQDKARQATDSLIALANAATDEDALLNAHTGEKEKAQLAWLKDKRPELYKEVNDAVATKLSELQRAASQSSASLPTSSKPDGDAAGGQTAVDSPAAAVGGDSKPEATDRPVGSEEDRWALPAGTVGQDAKMVAIRKLLADKAKTPADVDDLKAAHADFISKLGSKRAGFEREFGDRKAVLEGPL